VLLVLYMLIYICGLAHYFKVLFFYCRKSNATIMHTKLSILFFFCKLKHLTFSVSK